MAVLIDTNILFADWANDPRVDLSKFDPYINTIVWMEAIQGSKSKADVRKIKNVLAAIPMIHLEEEICIEAMRLIETYSGSHGLLLPDALIAATCLMYGLPLLTFNNRDFRFIAGLRLQTL